MSGLSRREVSFRELLENQIRFDAALEAVRGLHPKLVVYPDSQRVTRASRRVQVALPAETDTSKIQEVLKRYNAVISDTEFRSDRLSAWIYVYRNHSVAERVFQWALLVAGVALFLAGAVIATTSENRFGPRTFY